MGTRVDINQGPGIFALLKATYQFGKSTCTLMLPRWFEQPTRGDGSSSIDWISPNHHRPYDVINLPVL